MTVMHFIIFMLLFLGLDIALNLLTKKLIKFLGIDFLFLASWLAGINYGIIPGIVVATVLLAEHSLLHPSKSQFILFSFPAQLIAVLLGYFLGMNGFGISLVAYQIVNTGIMFATGGFGPLFVAFLVVNSLFNVIVYRVLLAVG
ncbi:MAG: hypothetical protein GW780_05105 [Candidatus Aenigmarchaeota archaeon]|nr:hypothetical protein [Candidatus Aenigmarchaeota archaeon]NCS71508.1 hypothetical protein [Candidatus Aenigmarchaeota archaeon]PIX50392.1 MAG: hypothetical protein COZ52_04400 [Candidatus Aenigmarchaeota archaeon CG_4_8_14_3_um_filter_37_24]